MSNSTKTKLCVVCRELRENDDRLTFSMCAKCQLAWLRYHGHIVDRGEWMARRVWRYAKMAMKKGGAK